MFMKTVSRLVNKGKDAFKICVFVPNPNPNPEKGFPPKSSNECTSMHGICPIYSLGISVIERKPATSFALYAVASCVSHLASAGKKATQALIPSVDQESTPSNSNIFF